MHAVFRWFHPVDTMPAWKFYLRLLLIVVQILLAYCLAKQNNPFFYQAF